MTDIEKIARAPSEGLADDDLVARLHRFAYRSQKGTHNKERWKLIEQAADHIAALEAKAQALWNERAQILHDAGVDELALIKRAETAEAERDAMKAALEEIARGTIIGNQDGIDHEHIARELARRMQIAATAIGRPLCSEALAATEGKP